MFDVRNNHLNSILKQYVVWMQSLGRVHLIIIEEHRNLWKNEKLRSFRDNKVHVIAIAASEVIVCNT